MKKLDSLSVFFPFWNEEENVKKVVESAIPTVQKITSTWEIIIVDDGSTDNTLKTANELAEVNKNIRVISHSQNRGYGGAIKEGLENAKYDFIVFTDGDGQFDFSEVERFLPLIEKNDIVIGARQKRKDNLIRHVLMKMLRVWDFIFFGISYKDIDCGFKMFRKDAVQKLQPLRSEGAMITTEILAKAKKKKLKIAQVAVSHYPRLYGKESGADLWVIIRAVLESFMLWVDLRMDVRSGRL